MAFFHGNPSYRRNSNSERLMPLNKRIRIHVSGGSCGRTCRKELYFCAKRHTKHEHKELPVLILYFPFWPCLYGYTGQSIHKEPNWTMVFWLIYVTSKFRLYHHVSYGSNDFLFGLPVCSHRPDVLISPGRSIKRVPPSGKTWLPAYRQAVYTVVTSHINRSRVACLLCILPSTCGTRRAGIELNEITKWWWDYGDVVTNWPRLFIGLSHIIPAANGITLLERDYTALIELRTGSPVDLGSSCQWWMSPCDVTDALPQVTEDAETLHVIRWQRPLTHLFFLLWFEIWKR